MKELKLLKRLWQDTIQFRSKFRRNIVLAFRKFYEMLFLCDDNYLEFRIRNLINLEDYRVIYVILESGKELVVS